MLIKDINKLFPFKSLVKLLLIFAVVFQALLISYNHLSGYYPLEGLAGFLSRWSISSLYFAIISVFIAYPDLYLIFRLNRHLPWSNKALPRLGLQLLFAVLIAICMSALFTLFSDLMGRYRKPLGQVMLANALIGIVINVVLMVIMEAWIFFNETKQARMLANKLERELSGIRFELLKSQINPHFMFNSLNVLSGLIEESNTKAQEFIEEFSSVYRYVLDTIEKPLVSLGEELDFVRSYMFLQQMRHGRSLYMDIDLPAGTTACLIPPMALQTVIENAIKHNIISKNKPLEIKVYLDNEALMISNNIQSKISSCHSTGLGQQNMLKRYALISNKLPEFTVKTNTYIARLPLLVNE